MTLQRALLGPVLLALLLLPVLYVLIPWRWMP